jgi:subtilase family serine protease
VNHSLFENLHIHMRALRGNFLPHVIRDLLRSLASLRGAAMCALALVAPFVASAQTNAVPSRIAAQINESNLTTLRGNTHPLARPQYDQGRVDPATKMERITMAFQRTAAQNADLDALLAAQQNPASPSFHQWLSSAQFGERFGIAQTDLQKVTAWLQARGLNVVETPDSKNFIVFEGTASQVESALHVEMHNYATSDTKFYSNSSEPSVPADLAAVVSGFRGLNNFRMKPRAIRQNPASGTPLPNFTSSISGNNFVAPGDFAVIYDLNTLYSASPAIDGTGQKIVVVGQSNIVPADIAAFRTASGLPANAPVVTLVPTSTDPGVLSGTGDEQESSIDIEWAGAVAKNATIDFVYSGNGVNDALQYAISNNIAPVISVSYGNCEALNPLSEIESLVALAQQANSQGITIVSSAGDGGATDCDGDLSNYPAILGLSVDVPASLPYVTGVGGTEFNEGNGAFWQKATNNTDVLTSALTYIPEKVWNDSSTTNGLSAGGGGASSVFGKPTWQIGTGVPADGARDVPDISVNASSMHDSYLVCVQFIPSKSSTFTSSCLNGTFRYSDTTLQAYGGTSFGAPTFAGILALINQKTASSGQGNVNYIL